MTVQLADGERDAHMLRVWRLLLYLGYLYLIFHTLGNGLWLVLYEKNVRGPGFFAVQATWI